MATFNRRMARRLCDQLGIWEDLKKKGIVDADPFVGENDEFKIKNLGKFIFKGKNKDRCPKFRLIIMRSS